MNFIPEVLHPGMVVHVKKEHSCSGVPRYVRCGARDLYGDTTGVLVWHHAGWCHVHIDDISYLVCRGAVDGPPSSILMGQAAKRLGGVRNHAT